MNYDLSFWFWARELSRSGECAMQSKRGEKYRDALKYENYMYLEIIFES
jgi:hypothetical protein